MRDQDLAKLLESVRADELSTAEAIELLRHGPFKGTDLDFAELDHHRPLRNGLGEVVYGESKSAEQIIAIVERLAAAGRPVLVTRTDNVKTAELKERFPAGRANTIGR